MKDYFYAILHCSIFLMNMTLVGCVYVSDVVIGSMHVNIKLLMSYICCIAGTSNGLTIHEPCRCSMQMKIGDLSTFTLFSAASLRYVNLVTMILVIQGNNKLIFPCTVGLYDVYIMFLSLGNHDFGQPFQI